MGFEEKILGKVEELIGFNNSGVYIGGVKLSCDLNNVGDNLFIVKASRLEYRICDLVYKNSAVYYAFDINGDFVCNVNVYIGNSTCFDEAVMEYWASPRFMNMGNVTVLAKHVLRDIYEKKAFDGLHTKGEWRSLIERVRVYIRDDNYPSLAVAEKLGFDKSGVLTKERYFEMTEKGVNLLLKKVN